VGKGCCALLLYYKVEVNATKALKELAGFGEMRPKGRGKSVEGKALTCFMCAEGRGTETMKRLRGDKVHASRELEGW